MTFRAVETSATPPVSLPVEISAEAAVETLVEVEETSRAAEISDAHARRSTVDSTAGSVTSVTPVSYEPLMFPIIRSLLDNDLYKFTMGQVAHDYANAVVRYRFINRDRRALPVQFAPELRAQVDAMA